LADLFGAAYDLETALEFCRRLETALGSSPIDTPLLDALTSAFVVRYARCFASGVRQRLPQRLIEDLPPDTRRLHDDLVALRDKHIAHSVNPFEENFVTVHVREAPDTPALGGIGTQGGRLVALDVVTTSASRDLVEHLLDAIKRFTDQLTEIVREEIETLPLDSIYQFPETDAFIARWRDVGRRR
jgi:hypothetical protein